MIIQLSTALLHLCIALIPACFVLSVAALFAWVFDKPAPRRAIGRVAIGFISTAALSFACCVILRLLVVFSLA